MLNTPLSRRPPPIPEWPSQTEWNAIQASQHKGHRFAVLVDHGDLYMQDVGQPIIMTVVPERRLISLETMIGEMKAEIAIVRSQLRDLLSPRLPHETFAAPPSESLTEVFGRLADRWHEDTDAISSPTRITGHDAYLKVISMGMPVVPLILQDLQERGGDWYKALRILTDANPVPPDHEGYPKKMKKDWLDWAQG